MWRVALEASSDIRLLKTRALAKGRLVSDHRAGISARMVASQLRSDAELRSLTLPDGNYSAG